MGPAAKLSKHLAALVASDAKTRSKAVAALRKVAIDQGELTDDALAVARAIAPAASDPASPALALLLPLAADLLVCGEADLWLTTGYDVRGSAFEQAPPEQRGRALYETFSAGVEDYLGHLNHAHAAVRSAVAPLLAYLGRETARIEPALRAQLPKEADASAVASLAVALGLHGRYRGEADATQALRVAFEGPDPVAVAGAALGLALRADGELPSVVLDRLLDVAAKQRKKLPGFAWHRGSLADAAVVVLAWVAKHRSDLALAERLVTASKKLPTQLWAAGALLESTFDGVGPTPLAPSDLDDRQRRAVSLVTQTDVVEGLSETLRRLCLPTEPKALVGFVDPAAASPLYRVVDGEPLLRTLARALYTDDGVARWRAALSSLSTGERIAVARGACCHPHRAWDLPCPSDVAAGDAVAEGRPSPRLIMSRLVALLTADLSTCSSAELTAAAEALAAESLKPPTYLGVLVFALSMAAEREGAPLPAVVDGLFRRINPESSFADREPVRRALAALPEDRREAIVLSRHFWHHQAPEPGEPALGGAWVIADLAPTSAVAEHVVAEIVSWTGGSAPYPEETAVDLLRCIGAPARPAIEAAITRRPQYVAVLERALEARR
ncbi:MAG: hypothetical protein R3B36_31290 [Polyangiaceae bacterium]